MPMPCCANACVRTAFIFNRNITKTYDDAVRARDGRAAALRPRPDTDDADRAAVKAQCHVHVLQNNAQETEQGRARSRVSLQDEAIVSVNNGI
jgi:hypothetical protein